MPALKIQPIVESTHGSELGSAAAGPEFVDELRRRSKAAHAQLFRRYHGRVMGIVHRMLGEDTELDDVVQEVFVRAMQAAPKFRGTAESLEPWLVRIAVLTTRTSIRKKVVRRKFFFIGDPERETAAPSGNAEAVETIRRLYWVLDQLSTKTRIPFTLRFVEHMTLPEIASACGVSEATAKRRVVEGRARFDRLVQRDPVLLDLIQRSGSRDSMHNRGAA